MAAKSQKKPGKKSAGKGGMKTIGDTPRKEGEVNPVTAFNSTILTLVGAYTATGSIIVTCGAGLVAAVFIAFLVMK